MTSKVRQQVKQQDKRTTTQHAACSLLVKTSLIKTRNARYVFLFCAGPSTARRLTVTRVFQDGIELNWLPPTEPNGEVHYVIYYTPEGGTERSIDTGSDLTHYNLTGLERNRVYTNIAVQAVNSAGRSGIRQNAIVTNYSHTVAAGEPTSHCMPFL